MLCIKSTTGIDCEENATGHVVGGFCVLGGCFTGPMRKSLYFILLSALLSLVRFPGRNRKFKA